MTEVVGCTTDDQFQPFSTVIGISPSVQREIVSPILLFLILLFLQTDWASHALPNSAATNFEQTLEKMAPEFVSVAACRSELQNVHFFTQTKSFD